MKGMATNKIGLSIIFLAAFSTAAAAAVTLSDSTGTIEIIESSHVKRPFRWQSTRSASDWVRISADAFGKDPVADTIGVLGLAISVPLTVVAVPFDMIAYPFRWNQVIRVRLRGQAVDSNRSPFKSANVVLTLKAKYPDSDIVSHQEYEKTIAGQTDEKGFLDFTTDLSFGPNSSIYLSVGLKNGGSFQEYWLTRKGGSLKVTARDFPNAWNLLAATR